MNYILEYWAQIAGILGVIGTPLGFLFGRKRAMAETRITQTDAIKGMQSAYDGWVEDDKARYALMKGEFDEFRKEMGLLRKENYQQREEIRQLRKAVDASEKREMEWKAKSGELERKYTSLKNAFERLKKKYEDKVNQTPSDGT